MTDTLLVRLKPYDPRRGHVLRRYTYAGIKFQEERGWYRVEKAVAEYLRGVRETPTDRYSPLAFDVCTEDEAQRVRPPLGGVPGAQPIAHLLHRHRGPRPEPAREARDEQSAGRSRPLEVGAVGEGRNTFQKLHRRGSRDGHDAVLPAYLTAAHVDRRAFAGADPQHLDPDDRADDVNERIERPQLVQMNPVGRESVHAPFDRIDSPQTLERPIPHAGRQPAHQFRSGVHRQVRDPGELQRLPGL